MESAKPIEAGCLAMVIPPANYDVGCTFTVMHKATTGERNRIFPLRWPQDEYWILSDGSAAATRCLLRIDDPDIAKQIESETEVTA